MFDLCIIFLETSLEVGISIHSVIRLTVSFWSIESKSPWNSTFEMVELPRDHPHIVCWGWRQLRWSCNDRMNPAKQSCSSVTRNFHTPKTKVFLKFSLGEILFLLIIKLFYCHYVNMFINCAPKNNYINNLYNLPPFLASGDRQGNQSRSAKSSFGTTSDAEEETPLGPVAMGDKLSLMCDEWYCFFS